MILGSGEINKDAKQLQPLRISAMEIKENKGNPESEIKENDDCQLTESKLNNDHPVVDVKTDDSSSVMGTKQDDNAVVMETKLNEDCPCEQTNNRSRKKSSKSKKSPKKRRNAVKKATVTTGIFGRLANKQKKQQGSYIVHAHVYELVLKEHLQLVCFVTICFCFEKLALFSIAF